jgi:hypothetical protein
MVLMTAEGFVEHLRTWLTEVAAEVDRTRPQNHELVINEKGEPALKRLRAKATPVGLLQLEEALAERIPERHLLDVLGEIDLPMATALLFGRRGWLYRLHILNPLAERSSVPPELDRVSWEAIAHIKHPTITLKQGYQPWK